MFPSIGVCEQAIENADFRDLKVLLNYANQANRLRLLDGPKRPISN